MPHYQPPLRDMHFVLHEVLDLTNELAQLPVHAGARAVERRAGHGTVRDPARAVEC